MASQLPPAAQQPLGALGRLPLELREQIYEYILPAEHDRRFKAKRSELPGKTPGLLFASRAIRRETIMLYFKSTHWTIGVKARGRGYMLCSAEPNATRLGRFSFQDKYNTATLDENTLLIRLISIGRASPGWPHLTFVMAQGGVGRIDHGPDCPACSPDQWHTAPIPSQGSPVVANAAVTSAPTAAPTYRDKALAFSQQYDARPAGPAQWQAPQGTVLQDLQMRYDQAISDHDGSKAVLEAALFGTLQLDRRGFSVRNLRTIAASMIPSVSSTLTEQAGIIRRLGQIWEQIHGLRA
ncbi:hypothetical protein LTR85_000482 [Meristemomyces frigidus]|nr:hypothetical protein LTR85_000482 [Meristemomyces frigidus]